MTSRIFLFNFDAKCDSLRRDNRFERVLKVFSRGQGTIAFRDIPQQKQSQLCTVDETFTMMKTAAFLLALLAAASAFAPASVSPRTSVAVNALFDDVSTRVLIVKLVLGQKQHGSDYWRRNIGHSTDREHGFVFTRQGPKQIRCPC